MEYELVELKDEDIPLAQSLCDRHVGEGLYDRVDFENIISDAGRFFYFIKVEDAIAGYFYCMYYEYYSDELLKELRLEQISDKIRNMGTVGICKSIGLNEEVRGKGISDSLLNYFTGLLFEKGCDEVLIPAWKQGDYVPAGKHLARCGFENIALLKHPWIEEKGLKCPYCNKGRCVCDAYVFAKKKNG